MERETTRPWLRRLLVGAGVTAGIVLMLGLVAYNFGSMMPPAAEDKAAFERLAANDAAPAIQEQFHIPIPGCVCHSDNPVIVMQHSNRRIKNCMECHGQ